MRLFCVCLLVLVGCEGRIGQPPAPIAVVPPGPVTAVDPCEGVAQVAGQRPLQRLTHEELDHSVFDLFGDATGPAALFPVDDALGGFSAALNSSPVVAEAGVRFAEQVAERAMTTPALVACADTTAAGKRLCAGQLIDKLGRKVWRRPLTADERSSLLGVYDAGAQGETHASGVQLVLEALLSSPNFLYHPQPGLKLGGPGDQVSLDGWALASRLSFLLWGSTPDDALLDAAAKGELGTPQGLQAQADRLLADPRSARAVTAFFGQWLGLSRLSGAVKDPIAYPGFTPQVAGDLQESMNKFLGQTAFGPTGSLRAVLTSDRWYTNDRIATALGEPAVTGSALVSSQMPAARLGLLGQPGFLALYGKSNESDPVHRGIFVVTKLQCLEMPPPPPNVQAAVGPPSDITTTRQRFEAATTNQPCASCHSIINPAGFAFEHFDGAGRYRLKENAFDINAKGKLKGAELTLEVDGEPDLARALAGSSQAARCISGQFVTFAVRSTPSKAELCARSAVADKFVAEDTRFNALLQSVVGSPLFTHQQLTQESP